MATAEERAGNQIKLGTSGWSYDHWKERFYPVELPKKKWFGYFTQHFDTVELNASFYRIPTTKITQGWNERSPAQFQFAVKISRLITHVKKLSNCERELDWFFSVFEPLKEKVCVYLLQLPPTMKYDSGRLEEFLALLPEQNRYAIEFRNSSWYTDKLYDLLREHNAIFCIHDMQDVSTGKIITSDTVYLRFHGHQALYGGDYPESELERWAEWIVEKRSEGKRVLGYFNNDLEAFAVKNCRMLQKMIAGRL